MLATLLGVRRLSAVQSKVSCELCSAHDFGGESKWILFT